MVRREPQGYEDFITQSAREDIGHLSARQRADVSIALDWLRSHPTLENALVRDHVAVPQLREGEMMLFWKELRVIFRFENALHYSILAIFVDDEWVPAHLRDI